MEYILEELLRQRKALAALMNGGSPEEQEDGRDEDTVRREQEMAFSDDRNWLDVMTGKYGGTAYRSGGAVRRGGGMTAAETVWDTYAEAAGEKNGYLGSVRRNGGEMASGRAAWEVLAEDGRAVFRREAGEDENGGVSAGKATAERVGWQLGRFHTGEQIFAGGSRLSGGAEAVEAVSVRTVTQWDGGTAETDARALSRAIQRDARRYDGGFMAR